MESPDSEVDAQFWSNVAIVFADMPRRPIDALLDGTLERECHELHDKLTKLTTGRTAAGWKRLRRARRGNRKAMRRRLEGINAIMAVLPAMIARWMKNASNSDFQAAVLNGALDRRFEPMLRELETDIISLDKRIQKAVIAATLKVAPQKLHASNLAAELKAERDLKRTQVFGLLNELASLRAATIDAVEQAVAVRSGR